VHLLPRHVFGQWFCLERANGAPLWEQMIFSSSSVHGAANGVIVASQAVVRGAGWSLEGCYGIDLETGTVRWTLSEDSPTIMLEGAECLCNSGRIISARDGRELRRITPQEMRERVRSFFEIGTEARVLYRTRYSSELRVRVQGGAWLTHRNQQNKYVRDGFRLNSFNDDSEMIWTFDLATTGYAIAHCNYYSYRLAGRYVYIVASEMTQSDKQACMTGDQKQSAPARARFHLLALDVTNGAVSQDLPLDDQPWETCRIEDIDDKSVLVSLGRRELRCYQRATTR